MTNNSSTTENFIPEKIKGNTYSVNISGTRTGIYFLNESEIVIIDAGRKESPELISYLSSHKLSVIAVIQTHLHIDHIANIVSLQKHFNAEIIAAESEPMYKGYEDIWKDVKVKKVPDNGTINIFGKEFRVLLTPGHSPGHWLIITPDNVGFAGDAVLSEAFLSKTLLPYMDNILISIESIKNIQNIDMDYLVAAHNGIIPREDIKRVCQLNIDKEYFLFDTLEKTIGEMLKSKSLRNKSSEYIREKIADKFMLDIGIYSSHIREYSYMHDTVNFRINDLIKEKRLIPEQIELLT